MKYDAIVVAGGVGKRADLGFNKVFYMMKNGKTVLENACHLFFEDEDCSKIIVVSNEEIDFDNEKLVCVNGGKERYNSVLNGLNEVTSEYVLIHDGARPFLNKIDLENVKKTLEGKDGVLLAKKATDTIKYVEDGVIKKTIDRNFIYQALTPQAFRTDVIKEAYAKVDLTNVTDDTQAVEMLGKEVLIVEGDKTNIKLTDKEDFENI